MEYRPNVPATSSREIFAAAVREEFDRETRAIGGAIDVGTACTSCRTGHCPRTPGWDGGAARVDA